jgi:hypothetical protein
MTAFSFFGKEAFFHKLLLDKNFYLLAKPLVVGI